jgi:CheY-like chemotaxis protein
MSSPTASSSGEPQRWRLLIADDDAAVRAFLSLALQKQFDLVGVAADSEEAVALAADTRPGAALIDVQMPKGGGLHALKGILGTSPETAVVMLSADEAGLSMRELVTGGAKAARSGTRALHGHPRRRAHETAPARGGHPPRARVLKGTACDPYSTSALIPSASWLVILALLESPAASGEPDPNVADSVRLGPASNCSGTCLPPA